ncbi:PaaI family thioesterase [Deferrisoma camini]|uniref:PaaI family thioesterase n=1 Tax=Deferrisoma camini TaxID=1035120 RepID=UPI00046D46E8|nr:PaaI family thioesterase [Deferrisoma camini]
MNLTWQDNCFVCGQDNPEGLRLAFRFDEEARSIETVWTPRPVHIGYEGIVHGGLVATLLDEALGKLTTLLGTPAVTAELTVRYHKPVPVGRPLRVEGRITRDRGRLLQGEARALLEDGTEAATATAKLLRTPRS